MAGDAGTTNERSWPDLREYENLRPREMHGSGSSRAKYRRIAQTLL
jgi:hypothetical protein